MAATETIPQTISDLAAKLDTTNQTLAAITLQIDKLSPSSDAASLDALAQAVAVLQADATAIKGALGIGSAPPGQALATVTDLTIGAETAAAGG